MKQPFLHFILLLVLYSNHSFAHEFWLQPMRYTANVGQTIAVQIKSGEGFEGIQYPWIPSRVASADAANFKNKSKSKVDLLKTSRGQLPAFHIAPQNEGLTALHYHSNPTELQYDTYEDFTRFLEEDGLQWVGDRHHTLGLPDTGWTELFSRHTKSLLRVGDGQGQDRSEQLPFEWIALTNPYGRPSSNGPLEFQLLENQVPVPSTQVTYFERKIGETGEIPRHIGTTDSQGIVQISVKPDTEYLISAVIMKERDSRATPWHSHWVSLTFYSN